MNFKTVFFGGLVLSFFLSGPRPGFAQHSVTDATGYQTQIAPDHPSRIVTLMPSLGEIAADLAGDSLERIVGVSDFTDYPVALGRVQKVASASHVNLEAVVGLHPDLIIASTEGNARDSWERLRELKEPVVLVNSASFQDLEQSIVILSQAMGEEERGKSILARFRAGLSQIEGHSRARGVHPTALMQLSSDPLIVVGGQSFLSEAIEKIGAVNVFKDLKQGYPRPAIEEVIRRDPDFILIPGNLGSEEAIQYWSRFPSMKAVKTGQVRAFRDELLMRPTPRILQGLIVLEHALWPAVPLGKPRKKSP